MGVVHACMHARSNIHKVVLLYCSPFIICYPIVIYCLHSLTHHVITILVLSGKCMGAAYAMGVVEETHHAWRDLVLGKKGRHIATLEIDIPSPNILSY